MWCVVEQIKGPWREDDGPSSNLLMDSTWIPCASNTTSGYVFYSIHKPGTELGFLWIHRLQTQCNGNDAGRTDKRRCCYKLPSCELDHAITHAVFLKTNPWSSGSIGIPKGSSFRIALLSLGFGAVGFGLVTTYDRNRLFPLYLQQ
jgi:hypothetical protein